MILSGGPGEGNKRSQIFNWGDIENRHNFSKLEKNRENFQKGPSFSVDVGWVNTQLYRSRDHVLIVP